MSWAAHNPEKYDELCTDGIIHKIEVKLGFAFDEEQHLIVDLALGAIRNASGKAPYDAWVNLCVWAGHEISTAEADWFVARAEARNDVL